MKIRNNLPFPAALIALLVIAGALIGCHSRYVTTTIDNQTPDTLRLLELDYPSASFGTSSLAPGTQFHYRFKIQGSGPLKLEFTDARGKIQNSDGPALQQGQEGNLVIVISPDGSVHWKPALTSAP